MIVSDVTTLYYTEKSYGLRALPRVPREGAEMWPDNWYKPWYTILSWRSRVAGTICKNVDIKYL